MEPPYSTTKSSETLTHLPEGNVPYHPVITRCFRNPHGIPAFAEGSPHLLLPDDLDLFLRELRDDLALMELEPAARISQYFDNRQVYPLPESCAPYSDAISLGFHLKLVLPLVFVKSKRGEPLSEARVALKYLRENQAQFASVLDTIRQYAPRVFQKKDPGGVSSSNPWLFEDVVQPYSMFTRSHVSMRTGLWVQTPPGMSTIITAPFNQKSPLCTLTGAIETDWHHLELFVVTEFPEFDGQVLLIEPEVSVAQLFFANRSPMKQTEIRFSQSDPGARPAYRDYWEMLSAQLVQEGRGTSFPRIGTASVDISCPHCYLSVSGATDGQLPDGHVLAAGFHPAYKVLQRAFGLRDTPPRHA
jgi:hypothetical protein